MEHLYDFTLRACHSNSTPSDETESRSNCTGDVHKQNKYRTIPVEKSLNGFKTKYDYSTKDCDLNRALTVKTESLSNLNRDVCKQIKYRDIPVGKSIDGLKTPSTYHEHISGLKETESGNMVKDSIVSSGLKATLNRAETRSNILRSRLESKLSINTVQQRTNYNTPFSRKNRQVSVSDPLLFGAKDRGDNIELQDVHEGNYFSKDAYGGEKQSPSVNNGFKGLLYIRNSGKMYKSLIRAESISTEMEDIFSMPLSLRDKNSASFGNSKLKNRIREESIFDSNKFKSENDECGDFEVAIFLSGIKNFSDQKSNGETIVTRYKKNEFPDNTDGKMKKKLNIRKKDSKLSVVQCKKRGASRKAYRSSIKILKINDQENEKKCFRNSHINRFSRFDTRGPNKTYKVNDSKFDFSSESDTEYVFEFHEGMSKNRQPMKQKSTSKSNVVGDAVKQKENAIRNPGLFRNSWENDHTSFLTRQMQQSSVNNFGDGICIPKVKISDEKLQEKFENIFKRYASTIRHSGEVIPRKISTQWMVNAGVVGKILSQREADNFFRQAAGTKVTMNSIEYKEFLITLTLRKKLPYYEIYRKMCDVFC